MQTHLPTEEAYHGATFLARALDPIRVSGGARQVGAAAVEVSRDRSQPRMNLIARRVVSGWEQKADDGEGRLARIPAWILVLRTLAQLANAMLQLRRQDRVIQICPDRFWLFEARKTLLQGCQFFRFPLRRFRIGRRQPVVVTFDSHESRVHRTKPEVVLEKTVDELIDLLGSIFAHRQTAL